MPPGWGEIPHVQALSQLPEYQGIYVLELRPRFREHYAHALTTIRDFVSTVS